MHITQHPLHFWEILSMSLIGSGRTHESMPDLFPELRNQGSCCAAVLEIDLLIDPQPLLSFQTLQFARVSSP